MLLTNNVHRKNSDRTLTAVLPLKLTDFGIAPPDFANTLKVADEFGIEVTIAARKS